MKSSCVLLLLVKLGMVYVPLAMVEILLEDIGSIKVRLLVLSPLSPLVSLELSLRCVLSILVVQPPEHQQ